MVKSEELKQFSGIDFEHEIRSDDNPSNTAEAWLNRIEVRLASFINSRLAKNIDYEIKHFSKYQLQEYKYAIMEQAIYVYRNGDISTDSGYDSDKGIIANLNDLDNIKISNNAIEHLKNCGLWSRTLTGKRGGYGAMW